jgi:predicted dehydrogenase
MSLNAAVIGCGNISRFHFSGLEKAGVHIKWAIDISEESARPWCQRYGAQYADDYRSALNDPEVDFVVITAPSRFHKEMALAAIEKKKPVICEKTLATNAEDSLQIVQAASEAGVIFHTAYMKRFIPAVQKARELLPSLGRIVSTYIRSYQPWGEVWGEQPEGSFLHTPAAGPSPIVQNYGGGILVCGGSHLLDLILFFFGRPKKLYAHLMEPAGRDYDLQANALFETDQSGVVHFEALAHPLKHTGFLRDGWDEQIEITGLEGKLEIYSAMWDQAEHKASRLFHYDNKTGRRIEYCYDPVSPFDCSTAFFVDHIRKGEQGSQSTLTGYEVDELIEHIYRSSKAGQSLEIQWKA